MMPWPGVPEFAARSGGLKTVDVFGQLDAARDEQ
jgi:hypothetical protein